MSKELSIDDYFELYLKHRIKYDRNYHIKNMELFDFSIINKKLIQKIFQYIDQVIFGGKLTQYVRDNGIEFEFKVPKSMKMTAGFFFWKYTSDNKLMMGIKISHNFFQNIVDKNIINIDLNVLDDNNHKYYSKNVMEPLITTMEHEMLHMLMFVTKENKLNDLHTMKSGHTKVFKELIYNIFGHHKVTHMFHLGDVSENENAKENIYIGSYVLNIKNNKPGYVVMMKEKSVIICHINEDTHTYSGIFFKDVKLLDMPSNNPINVQHIIDKLKPNISVMLDGKTYTITQVNNVSVKAINRDNKSWILPKFRILDYVFV
jgi:hypothetical protein